MAEDFTPILGVENAELAVAWYERPGFKQESVHLFEPGFTAFVTIRRGPAQLFLSEH